ncbi:hypothetical protein HPB48_025225 [Haemaphysalis longicornis]|uniref:Uncharacterized protein n=1 Tax=Haemaphysalis longicornis TaxID=44386 RepID=A0A9J6H9C1_HAELO|nr:hypothetical protein HPB48_025225 [Haemaphysalis longicornis]
MQWRRAISYTEKRLTGNTAVFELHFGDRYISRHIEHTVDREVVSIYRGRPRLPPEAVPTQFPYLLKYQPKQLPRAGSVKREVHPRPLPAIKPLRMVTSLGDEQYHILRSGSRETPLCLSYISGDRYISRHIEHTVDREVVSIYRGRASVAPEAVPTQFPYLPKYQPKTTSPSRTAVKREVHCGPYQQ